MSRSTRGPNDLPASFEGVPRFEDFEEALAKTKPDAVSINSWPDSHAAYALRAFDAGCHVFMEKPIATNAADAEKIYRRAPETQRKLGTGQILRVHPPWA